MSGIWLLLEVAEGEAVAQAVQAGAAQAACSRTAQTTTQ